MKNSKNRQSNQLDKISNQILESFSPIEVDYLLKTCQNKNFNIGTIYEELSLLDSINEEKY